MSHFDKSCFGPQAETFIGIFPHIKGCVNQLKEASERGLKLFPLLHASAIISYP